MEPRKQRGAPSDGRIPPGFAERWIGKEVRRRGHRRIGTISALRWARGSYQACVQYPSRLEGTFDVWESLRALEEVTP